MATRKVTMGSTLDPEENAPKTFESPAVADLTAALVPEKEEDNDTVYPSSDDVDDEGYESYALEDLDPETNIWIGGPTVKQVLAWKEEHGDVYITNVTMDKHVVWRTLKRTEYKHLVRTVENLISSGKMTQSEAGMFNEELTCEICSLAPHYVVADFDKDLAGLPAILSQQILESSGFTTIDVRLL